MMATTWVDFKQLKADVAIEQVLAHYGVHLRRIGATELRGRCPLPTHTSSSSRDSFAVNIARNVWSCRSMSCMQARGGRPGGNILDLVALMESCSIRDAALRLQGWSGAAPERFIVPRASRPDPVTSENPPLRFALQYIDATHPYLVSRGVTPPTIRTFGLGLYTGKGLLRGRIVIPIHNACGELIAYAGRTINGHEPKYRFPAGFRKSLVLFNLHRAIATKASTVLVVEGFFDAIAVHQAGYPVVGLMGSTVSRHQADLLTGSFDRVVLMLDGDEAGQHGALSVAQALVGRMSVSVISLEDGRQPDQLTPAETRRLLREGSVFDSRSHGSWTEQDDPRTDQADGRANDIPAIRSRALDRPEPEERCRDVDAAVGRVRATGRGGVDERQQIGEDGQGGDAGHEPPRRGAQAQPGPEAEAAGDLSDRRSDVGQQ
jgi:hypothetical protein